jgi:hypothetical protein
MRSGIILDSLSQITEHKAELKSGAAGCEKQLSSNLAAQTVNACIWKIFPTLCRCQGELKTTIEETADQFMRTMSTSA